MFSADGIQGISSAEASSPEASLEIFFLSASTWAAIAAPSVAISYLYVELGLQLLLCLLLLCLRYG